jgi:uncharacterized membrane protein
MLAVYALRRLRADWVRTALVGVLIVLGMYMVANGLGV